MAEARFEAFRLPRALPNKTPPCMSKDRYEIDRARTIQDGLSEFCTSRESCQDRTICAAPEAPRSPVFVCQDNRKPRGGSPSCVSPRRWLTDDSPSSRQVSQGQYSCSPRRRPETGTRMTGGISWFQSPCRSRGGRRFDP